MPEYTAAPFADYLTVLRHFDRLLVNASRVLGRLLWFRVGSCRMRMMRGSFMRRMRTGLMRMVLDRRFVAAGHETARYQRAASE
jgi:hypothetical protein